MQTAPPTSRGNANLSIHRSPCARIQRSILASSSPRDCLITAFIAFVVRYRPRTTSRCLLGVVADDTARSRMRRDLCSRGSCYRDYVRAVTTSWSPEARACVRTPLDLLSAGTAKDLDRVPKAGVARAAKPSGYFSSSSRQVGASAGLDAAAGVDRLQREGASHPSHREMIRTARPIVIDYCCRHDVGRHIGRAVRELLLPLCR